MPRLQRRRTLSALLRAEESTAVRRRKKGQSGPETPIGAGLPLGNISGLSTALQNAVDKPLMTTDIGPQVAATAQILTSEPENLKSDDISNAMKIVNRILNDSSIAFEQHELQITLKQLRHGRTALDLFPQVVKNLLHSRICALYEVVVVSAVTTVSQILSAQPDKFSNEVVEKEAESLTRTLEALSVNNTRPVLSVVQPSVAIETRQLSTMNFNGISFMSLREIRPAMSQAYDKLQLVEEWLQPETLNQTQMVERVVVDRLVRALSATRQPFVGQGDLGTLNQLISWIDLYTATQDIVQEHGKSPQSIIGATQEQTRDEGVTRGLTDDLVSSRIIVDNDTSMFVLNETAEVQIFVKPVGKMNDNDTVGFVLYQNDNLFASKHKKTLGFQKKIISASISGASVNIQFSFNQQVNSSYILLQYACVFWDYKWSEWNTTGCQKKISNQTTSNETSSNSITSLQCTCNHTTNFAVFNGIVYFFVILLSSEITHHSNENLQRVK
ncbi:unnamed protein product [Ranitomeya imitator]|uniref:GPS domain-containing protein n=1 Tax=Ranitomeya imitator TaxID=111125 RepID=A0ABN9LWL9_9NEOB|nr:unnamed protein product [Ranitomeya imitator]